jgi:hypothetical protein
MYDRYAYMYVRTSTCIHTHICIHIHTHTHTHNRCGVPPSRSERIVEVMRELHRRRQKSDVFAGKHAFLTPRDLFRYCLYAYAYADLYYICMFVHVYIYMRISLYTHLYRNDVRTSRTCMLHSYIYRHTHTHTNTHTLQMGRARSRERYGQLRRGRARGLHAAGRRPAPQGR